MEWIELSVENVEIINQQLPYKLAKIHTHGKYICVTKTNEGIFGVSNSCPHAGAALHHGHCNKMAIISCPLHGYKFNIKNGNSVDGNNYKIPCYEFKIKENKIFYRRK
jgi:nitrite reductase/ring-hydroxylating ferredoxin subunit